MNGPEPELAAAWEREVLAGAPDVFQRHLAAAVAARDLNYLGRPVVDVLRPVFVGAALYQDLCRSAGHVARALGAAADSLSGTPASWDAHRLEAWERRALELDSGGLREVVGRLDAFTGGDGTPRFLEYNPVPAGVVEPEELCEVFSAFEPAGRFLAARGLSFDRTRSRVPELLRAEHARRGGAGAPRVTLLCHPSGTRREIPLSALPETLKLLADLAHAGIGVDRCAWDAPQLQGDDLATPDGRPLEVVLVDDWESFQETDAEHPLWGAVRRGQVWLANSLRARVALGRKSLFEPLSDEAFLQTLPEETAEACRRSVPWTRVVSDRPTDHEGRPVDLLAFVRERRERLVLKPANRSGGAGVVIGALQEPAAWERALERAVGEPYVVQERVEVRKERFPCGLSGAVRWEERSIDLCPLVWLDGSAHGLVARASSGALMNLTAGDGSLVPVFRS